MQSQMANAGFGKEVAEKTARSIFVGNIPYEATEEKLIELFSKAGPVLGFRLVYDRESGKPKGYGFCEYGNAATAASALRNLHNIDFNGRPLRIGPAAGEQNSAEVALSNPSVGPPIENAHGAPVDPKHAPEAISRAVASLPPEQMYELMKQMKLCIQNNPNEARNMLLQNPQLAYALLQAQIVMKIVDPKVAIGMLNRSHDQIPPARPDNGKSFDEDPNPAQPSANHGFASSQVQSTVPQMLTPQQPTFLHSAIPQMIIGNGNMMAGTYHGNQPMPPTGVPMRSPNQMLPQDPQGAFTSEFASVPQDTNPSIYSNPPMVVPGMQPPPSGYPQAPRKPFDRPPFPSQPPVSLSMNASPQFMPPTAAGGPPPPNTQRGPPPDRITHAAAAAAAASIGPNNILGNQGEQEKIALIMQVLNLSEESIAQLPEDQRRSILILKEQVRKTGVI